MLLIPYDMDVSLARFPVGNKDVLITDLHGISKKKAKVIGIAVIQAGASAAIYLGPQNRSILFQPEVTE